MKYSWTGHKDRKRHENRIKRSGQARLVYVFDINHNIPITRWAHGDGRRGGRRNRCKMSKYKGEERKMEERCWVEGTEKVGEGGGVARRWTEWMKTAKWMNNWMSECDLTLAESAVQITAPVTFARPSPPKRSRHLVNDLKSTASPKRNVRNSYSWPVKQE